MPDFIAREELAKLARLTAELARVSGDLLGPYPPITLINDLDRIAKEARGIADA